jgi:hypothetical protein
VREGVVQCTNGRQSDGFVDSQAFIGHKVMEQGLPRQLYGNTGQGKPRIWTSPTEYISGQELRWKCMLEQRSGYCVNGEMLRNAGLTLDS